MNFPSKISFRPPSKISSEGHSRYFQSWSQAFGVRVGHVCLESVRAQSGGCYSRLHRTTDAAVRGAWWFDFVSMMIWQDTSYMIIWCQHGVMLLFTWHFGSKCHMKSACRAITTRAVDYHLNGNGYLSQANLDYHLSVKGYVRLALA